MKLRSVIFYSIVFVAGGMTAGVFLCNLDDPKVVMASLSLIALVAFLYWDDGQIFTVQDEGGAND